jgi:hypothetical protein
LSVRVGAGRANVPRDACFLLYVNAGAVVAGSAAHGVSAGLSLFGAGIVLDLDGSQFWGFTCIIFSEDLEILVFFCTTTRNEKGRHPGINGQIDIGQGEYEKFAREGYVKQETYFHYLNNSWKLVAKHRARHLITLELNRTTAQKARAAAGQSGAGGGPLVVNVRLLCHLAVKGIGLFKFKAPEIVDLEIFSFFDTTARNEKGKHPDGNRYVIGAEAAGITA